MVLHACSPSTWALEAEGSNIHAQYYIYTDFEANLGYMRPGLNKTKESTNEAHFGRKKALNKWWGGDSEGHSDFEMEIDKEECY